MSPYYVYFNTFMGYLGLVEKAKKGNIHSYCRFLMSHVVRPFLTDLLYGEEAIFTGVW